MTPKKTKTTSMRAKKTKLVPPAAPVATITPERYRELIAALGLSQVAAGHFAGYVPRQSRRYASGDRPVPEAVAMLLELMVHFKVRPERARKLAGLPEEFAPSASLEN